MSSGERRATATHRARPSGIPRYSQQDQADFNVLDFVVSGFSKIFCKSAITTAQEKQGHA